MPAHKGGRGNPRGQTGQPGSDPRHQLPVGSEMCSAGRRAAWKEPPGRLTPWNRAVHPGIDAPDRVPSPKGGGGR